MTDEASTTKEEFYGVRDIRPQLGGWAPGRYNRTCLICDEIFIGDKRATMCAVCAHRLWAGNIGISEEPYTAHVLGKLVGIKGSTQPAVVAFILRSWIADHRRELNGYGIGVGVDGGVLELNEAPGAAD